MEEQRTGGHERGEPFLGSASGLSRQRLRAQRYRRETRGVYTEGAPPTRLVLSCRSLQVALPDAVVSHRTAAALLALPLPALRRGDDGTVVHLTRPPGACVSERPGTRTHRATLDVHELVVVDAVRATGPARTFLDLAATGASVEDLVCAADVIARRYGIAVVRGAICGITRRRGIVSARAAAAACDPRSGSPAESRVRVRLHAAGFTGFAHGVVVRDELSGWLAEPDLADVEARVAIQYEGLVHFDDDEPGLDELERRRRQVERRRKDADRDELCRVLGWEVVVLTAIDLRDPHRMLAKVRAAYARSASRRPPSAHPRASTVGLRPAPGARTGA